MIIKNNLFEFLETIYPRNLAENWDKIGLSADNLKIKYNKILLTIDVTYDVIQVAQEINADLIVSHHPLYIDFVTESSNNIHKLLIEKNIDLFVIHTNGDKAPGGVNDSLAKVLELVDIREFGSSDLGRIGKFKKPLSIKEIIYLLQDKLPKHRGAIQVSGDLNKNILTVGVCSGSGGTLLEMAKEYNLDLFITSDLKHHKVLENLVDSGPILISVSHWASEFIWLPNLRNQIECFLKNYGVFNGVELFEKSTDPWTFSLGSLL
jgi:dinuclear metal center YbgI/SA1388 family protein